MTRKEKDLVAMLLYAKPFNGKKPICDRSEHLHTANAVCIREDILNSIHPDFRIQLRDNYNGDLFSSVDFSTVRKVWHPDIGREMVPLLEEMFESNSIMIMINTVIFDAMWQYPYEDTDIKRGTFRNADHTEIQVNMLHGGTGYYVENEYGIGFVKKFQQCKYVFMALLPKDEGSDALWALAEATDFYDLVHHQKQAVVHTMMPEFSVSFKENMNEVMSSLGIREVFTNRADFSSISTEPLFVDQMIHQARIEVNRNGVSAAAATTLYLLGSCPPEDEKFVLIDRPFVFAIVHENLGLPVFVGVVNKV